MKKVPASAEATGFLLAADLNGDGRLDLAYPVAQQQRPLCFRLQDETGEVGPERFAEVPPFRAADSVHWAEGRRDYLAFILAASGRLEVRRLQAAETSGSAAEGPTLRLYPLEKDKVSRRFVLCDLNRDGRLDVVTTYPSTAQVGVFFQREAGGLAQPVLYPSFSAVSAMTAGDLDGDGKPEVVFAAGDGSLQCVGADGSRRWMVFLGDRADFLGFADVDADGKEELLAASANCLAYCIEAGGKVRWARSLPQPLIAGCLVGRLLSVAQPDGEVIFLAPGDGRPVAARRLQGEETALRCSAGTVYAATRLGQIAALAPPAAK